MYLEPILKKKIPIWFKKLTLRKSGDAKITSHRRQFLSAFSFLSGGIFVESTMPETGLKTPLQSILSPSSPPLNSHFEMFVIWKAPAHISIESTKSIKAYEKKPDSLTELNHKFTSTKKILKIESEIHGNELIIKYIFKSRFEFLAWEFLRRRAGHGIDDTRVKSNRKLIIDGRRFVINTIA